MCVKVLDLGIEGEDVKVIRPRRFRERGEVEGGRGEVDDMREAKRR